MLNGFVDYIFGGRKAVSDETPSVCANNAPAGQVTDNGAEPQNKAELMDETYDEEWILVNENSPVDVDSSRSSPVLVRQPMADVMEASDLHSFLDSPSGSTRSKAKSRSQNDNRALVARMLLEGATPYDPKGQHQAEQSARMQELSQSKIKRNNHLNCEQAAQPKTKPRKMRIKNHSGRNIDRKCQ